MAKHSMGTTLQIGATTIGELTEINAPEITMDSIDVTNLSSTDGYREFIPGIKDGGEVSLTGFFAPGDAGQVALKTALDDKTSDSYTITFPTSLGATWTFTGFITSYKAGDATIEDPANFEITLKITGKPNLGTTASGGLTNLSLTGTGGTLSPSFSAALRSYTFGGVSASSCTITPTAASHTIKLYIDGVYSQDITSGQASSAISLTLNVSKKLTLIAYEAAKNPITYDIIVVKTS